jgi:uncharacterized protein YqgC (DUF456 family)
LESLNVWIGVIGKSLTLIIMLFSLFGLIIPIFPGTVIIWLVALIFGIASGFGTVGTIIFAILTVLALLGALADNILMGAKAKEHGASWGSILLALGGGILFTLIFPPIGGLVAAPVILYLAERNRNGDHDKALNTVKALVIGWGWAFVIRFGIGVVMIGLWGIWALSV